MKLTGTTDHERIDSAIAFAKAHRSHDYDHCKITEIYHKAGVPFTEAAEKFWRKWYGVLEQCVLYPDSPNVSCDDGNHYIIDVDFSFCMLANAEELKYRYEPTTYPDLDENYCEDIGGMIRAKYGIDTVPVASGGYYYPDSIYIRPNGKIISILPDNGYDSERFFDSLKEFLYFHLHGLGSASIEKVIEFKNIEEGSMEERIAVVMEFAKSHGGFQHCRLFAEMYERSPLDLSKITKAGKLSDDETARLLLEILKDNTPKYYTSTTLPCQIRFVEE